MQRRVLERKEKGPHEQRFKPGLHVFGIFFFFGRNVTVLQVCGLHKPICVYKKITLLKPVMILQKHEPWHTFIT